MSLEVPTIEIEMCICLCPYMIHSVDQNMYFTSTGLSGWGIYYANEGPHKDSTSVFVWERLVHLLDGLEWKLTLEQNGLNLHTRRLRMNNTPHYHHVLLISEHPKNILQVHRERGQKVPQCPQEPLRGHPSMWVKQTHARARALSVTVGYPHMLESSHVYAITHLYQTAASVCWFKLYALFHRWGHVVDFIFIFLLSWFRWL